MMKGKKKIAIVIAVLSALTLSGGIFAACKGGDDTPPKYEFGGSTGSESTAQPDEGFVIDGKFDEAAYANQKWLHAVKVEKDNDNLIYDNAVSDVEWAAKFSMTSVFGEKGIYVATIYKAAAGEQLFVNTDRTSYINSITELYFSPSGTASAGDIGLCEIDMEPTGKLTFKRLESNGSYVDFATTSDIMAKLGVTCNGLVGESIPEGYQRATEYTCELFIPWAYVDKIGGEGTADAIKADGEIRLNAAPITSYNYDGKNASLDRWWWMMGSQLDKGSGNKASSNGWYHFNKEGLIAYDLEIHEAQGGKVMERFGYDFAVANNSVTILLQANDGHAIKDIKVNGASYYDEIEYPDSLSFGTGYIVIPASKVVEDLTVEAEFVEISSAPVSFNADVYGLRFGKKYEIAGATKVTLTGPQTYTLDISGGKATGSMIPGRYSAKLVGEEFEDYPEILVNFLGGDFDLVFSRSAFTQNKFGFTGPNRASTIDDTHANEENGYITGQGNSFFPVTNESFGDSVFTINSYYAMASSNWRHFIRYIFAGTNKAVEPYIRYNAGKLYAGWYNGDNWGVSPVTGSDAKQKELPQEFADAYLSDKGVDLTMVRYGLTFYVFVSTEDAMYYFDSYTVGSSYENVEGHWSISVWDSVNNIRVAFSLDDSAGAAEKWTSFHVDLKQQGNGTATANKTTAHVGETVTITVTPDAGYYAVVLVNGKTRRIVDGKVEVTVRDGLEVEVEVTFVEYKELAFELAVENKLWRLGKEVSLEGAKVILSGDVQKEFVISGGKISGSVLPGIYSATLDRYEGAIQPVEIELYAADDISIDKLAFTYKAFTQGIANTTINDSHANEENGYVTNQSGSAFFPMTNEAFGDSVFTANFSANYTTDNGANGSWVRYIFANTTTCLMPTFKMNGTSFIFQWKFERNVTNAWGYTSLESNQATDKTGAGLSWALDNLPERALNAYRSAGGLNLTMVRNGNVFYAFVWLPETGEVVGYNLATLTSEQPATGHWAMSIGYSAANSNVHFTIDESAEAVAEWVNYGATLTVDGENGTAALNKTSAKIGEKIVLTVIPDEGYYALVTVNGEVREMQGNALVLSFDDGKDIKIEVTFTEIQEAEEMQARARKKTNE